MYHITLFDRLERDAKKGRERPNESQATFMIPRFEIA